MAPITKEEALLPRENPISFFTGPTEEWNLTTNFGNLSVVMHTSIHLYDNAIDFVVGRLGYGSIKFLGETDVRKLDIESHVQFNHREVVVYMDETKKPPVGQGLNKAAEISLFSIKCIDKETGIDGPKVDKYKEMLIRKTDEQGSEFVSYDPVQGEWKFRVQHF